ncbi:MAG: glycosyltransferase family 4 protein [Candidatus Roizmanbacteria bacterium]|nr:glycosyltransferase family 4 protein [Candidatus Roizmanbacteria bacterium]
MHSNKKKCPKVAFILNIPTSYVLPLLVRLCNDQRWNLHVYFCGVSHADRFWNLNIDHPQMHVLSGIATRPRGSQWFTNHFNLGIAREILKHNFDVVVVGGYAVFTFQIAMALAKIKKVPYVINTETHTHTSSKGWILHKLKQRIRYKICHGAAAFLVTGSRVSNYLGFLGIPEARHFVFPNTCDVKWFAKQSEKARREADAIRKKFSIDTQYIILCVGRLVKVKNLNTLIDAFSLLPTGLLEKTSLVFVGEGSDRHELEEKKEVLKLRNVKFLGHQEGTNLASLYGIANIFVLLSTFEPWGVVVNEAAACGLPLILSRDVGAADDLLEDGRNGFLVDPLEQTQVSKHIAYILSDEMLAKKMGERSHRIVEDWTYKRCYDGFEQMLRYLGKL